MFQEFFTRSELLSLPVVALLIFFSVFVLVVARVLLIKRDDAKMRRIARLPMDDEAPMAETADLKGTQE